jgi:hypothetical protein
MMPDIGNNDDEQKNGISAKYVTCRYEKTQLVVALPSNSCHGLLKQSI